MRRHLDLWLCGLVVLLGISGQIGRAYGAIGSGWRDLTLVQGIAFPLFLVVVWRCLGRLPHALALRISVGALFLVGAGVLFSGYSFRTHDARAIVVARLGGDEFDSESRIFRDRLDAAIKGYYRPLLGVTKRAPRTVRYHTSVANQTEAQALLRRSGGARTLVWGNERWLQMSFSSRESGAHRLGDTIPLPSVMADLRLVRSVPLIGLSFEPTEATIDFLATTLTGLVTKKSEYFEIAARKESFWTSSVHRALPALWAGNAALERAIKGGGYQPGELACALAWYQGGLGSIPQKEHRELVSALENNIGAALYIRGIFERRYEDRKEARALWRRVLSRRRGPDRYQLPMVVALSAIDNIAATQGKKTWDLKRKKKGR